jgi:hypothetical protein
MYTSMNRGPALGGTAPFIDVGCNCCILQRDSLVSEMCRVVASRVFPCGVVRRERETCASSVVRRLQCADSLQDKLCCFNCVPSLFQPEAGLNEATKMKKKNGTAIAPAVHKVRSADRTVSIHVTDIFKRLSSQMSLSEHFDVRCLFLPFLPFLFPPPSLFLPYTKQDFRTDFRSPCMYNRCWVFSRVMDSCFERNVCKERKSKCTDKPSISP